MKKKNNLVFFSCVVKDVYKEFKIEEESLGKMKELLKREVFYNRKYTSTFTDEEIARAFKREAFLTKILENELPILSLDQEDVAFKQWVKDVLSKIELKETFSLSDKDIPRYFYAMKQNSLVGANTSVYEQQLRLYADATENAVALQQNGIEIKENRFEIKQQPQKETEEHVVVLEKKTVPYSAKKIS